MPNHIAFSNYLLEGARNCVVNAGGASEGMNVLILSLVNDERAPVDDLAVQVLATACQEVGAKPQILWATGMEKGWWDDPSPIILGAMRSADLVINNRTPIERPIKAVREIMFRDGVPFVRNMTTTVASLASEWARFPFPLSDEITRRVGQLLDKSMQYRIVAPSGTDISGGIAPPSPTQSGFTEYGVHRRTRKNRPFPQGCFVPVTSVGANGVIVSTRTLPIEARHLGISELTFSEPVRFTVSDNKIVNIEGGKEAAAVRRFYEETEKHLGEDAWNFSSFHAGINPKSVLRISPEQSPDIRHRFQHNHPSVLHVHLGGSKLVKDYDYPYMFHLSMEMDDATLYLDGEKLYEDGDLLLLDDEEVRKVAAQYGDPDDLLTPVELPRLK